MHWCRQLVRHSSTVASRLNIVHPRNNIPDSIKAKVGKNLHLSQGHPLGQLTNIIRKEFTSGHAAPDKHKFVVYDDLAPIVSVKANFDDLLIPADHVSRSPTDTFYVDDSNLLRCHMTAHQAELIRKGEKAFLMIGDVYRRDEIDATHYPVFHQVDGVRLWTYDELPSTVRGSASDTIRFVTDDLKATVQKMVAAMVGNREQRWVDAYFPFTDPSYELEVSFDGAWLEMLGSGMIRHKIIDACGAQGSVGWAFGMGLERLAMVLYGIPDIRLFWSEDPRFLSQFTQGGTVKFKPYSKFPPCYKDITFWLPTTFHENDFFELVREVAGDMVENVKCLDKFVHPKTKRTSHCYRIMYRHMDRNLINEEVDEYQAALRQLTVSKLGCELR